MQKFEFLRQTLLGELAMSRKKKEERRREKNAICSGHLRLCQQPRAAYALRSDQNKKIMCSPIVLLLTTQTQQKTSIVIYLVLNNNNCLIGPFTHPLY